MQVCINVCNVMVVGEERLQNVPVDQSSGEFLAGSLRGSRFRSL